MNDLLETKPAGGGMCGDGAALVSYLYGEGTEAERERMAAHLARCAACAEDIAALGATREQLTSWAPPDSALGFRITQADAAASPAPAAPTVLTSARWWKQPMPAWAQLAAAVVIFASGLAIGTARHTATPAAATVASAPAPSPTMATVSSVSRDDLAQLEARLQNQIADVRTAKAAALPKDAASMERVKQLIVDSEQRQRQQLAEFSTLMARDVAATRAYNQNNIQQIRGGIEVLRGRTDANSMLIKTALPGASSFQPDGR